MSDIIERQKGRPAPQGAIQERRGLGEALWGGRSRIDAVYAYVLERNKVLKTYEARLLKQWGAGLEWSLDVSYGGF
jgi:hypothetical protein